MFNSIGFANYLQRIIVILVTCIPPWIAIFSNIRRKKGSNIKTKLRIFFLLYLVVCAFTNNIVPTILTIIYLVYLKTSKNKNEEKYYIRPLEKKEYSFKGDKKDGVVIIASDRISIIIKAVIFKCIVTAIGFAVIVFLTSKDIQIEDQAIVGEFLGASLQKSIYLGFLMIITAPILEEFIFRHLFYRGLKSKMGKIFSALITSVFFALFHYHFEGLIIYFSIGVYSCYLYEGYGYRACVLNHFIFNLISVAYMVFIRLN